MIKPTMPAKSIIAGLAALGLLAATAANDAFAQTAQGSGPAANQLGPRVAPPPQQQPRGPKREVVATHGDWKLTCEEPKKDATGKTVRACGMVQTVRHEQRQNIILTLVLVKAVQGGKPATMMRVMAPIGVFLPTGVALEIDGAAVGRVPFTRCLPRVCVAFAEARPDTLKKLKAGAKATFTVYEAPGLGVPMNISLKGFTAGLEALDKL